MNAEILARLERSFVQDPAMHIVELLKPLTSLDDKDRAKAAEMLVGIAALLVKKPSRK